MESVPLEGEEIWPEDLWPPEQLLERHADHPELDPIDRVGVAIQSGFGDPDFTADEAARLAGMSPRRLRYLLAEANTTYRTEVLNLRMKKAEQLLKETNFLISAIAELCGYRCKSTFAERFGESHGGLSPKQYRMAHGGVRRAGGPTGAAKQPAERGRALRRGEIPPPMYRTGEAPGESDVRIARIYDGVRQARAFGRLPRQGGISVADMVDAEDGKRRRGTP